MALPENSNKIQYTVTSAEDTFPFPNKYWDETDLVVTVLSNSTGIETVLDINAGDYTVSPTNGDAALGANVITALSYSNDTITIERIIPVDSGSDFITGDGIPPDALNNELDKKAAQSQQLGDQIVRQVTHPVSDPSGLNYGAPTVELRKSRAMGWDSTGNIVALDLVESGAITGDTSKGIDVTSNVISAKTDGTTTGFNGSGDIEVKDDGLSTDKYQASSVTKAKIEDVASYKVLGNTTGSATSPEEVDVLDEDSMVSDSNSSLATQQSIKAYVDNSSADGYVPSSYSGQESTTLPNGLIMKAGRIARVGTDTTVTYGASFPNAVISVSITNEDTGGATISTSASVGDTNTTSSFNIRSGTGATHFNWIAIGY